MVLEIRIGKARKRLVAPEGCLAAMFNDAWYARTLALRALVSRHALFALLHGPAMAGGRHLRETIRTVCPRVLGAAEAEMPVLENPAEAGLRLSSAEKEDWEVTVDGLAQPAKRLS